MTDTPEAFIIRVIEADQYMVDKLDDKTLMDILTGPLVGLPVPDIKSPVNIAISRRINNLYDNVKNVVINKPSCIDDYDTYGLLKFILKAETRFAIDVTHRTFINEHLNIPSGMEETINELDNISLCG